MTKFHCLAVLLGNILGNMCIEIVCKPCCDVMNFEVNLKFLIKKIFTTWYALFINYLFSLNVIKVLDKSVRTLFVKRGFTVPRNITFL